MALRPLRTWLEQVAARTCYHLAVTLSPGTDPHELLDRVGNQEGVSVRLRSIEKCDGRLVAIIDVEGRPEAAVCAMTARLAELSEVTDLARQ